MVSELAVTGLQLTLVHLYPTLMNVYGDRGNIIALAQRCAWRQIQLCVKSAGVGDEIDPEAVDLLFFGGGQDQEQSTVAADLRGSKGEALRQAVEQGAAALAICGGYQLLGHYFRTSAGEELPGVGIFDAWTEAGPKRSIGNVVVQTELCGTRRTLVGFENHSGQAFLGPGSQPLGKLVVGRGNNGRDGTEGAVSGNAFGCYLHGPLLPKNPWFADLLLERALRRRYGPSVELPPLDDHLEQQAHQRMLQRAPRLAHRQSGAW